VLNHCVKGFQVGVLLREVAEGAVHLEADLEVRFGVVDVAEQGFVASHVVIIDRLFQEGDWTSDEEIFRFGGFAELVETKTGVKKTGAGIGSDAAKSLAHAQGEGPFLFSHEMMETELKNFRAVLVTLVDGVEFGERLACHAELCVAAGGLQLPFELHGFLFSKSLAMGMAGLAEFQRPGINDPGYNKRVSSSANLRSKRCSVLSISADVAMSTPAARSVSSGNFEPPDFRKSR